MQILLANPRGFCAGVDRAISIVENALAIYGAPIYVRHEVVHNRYVVDSLRERGAIFIEQISEVPDGAILIFSAHGVSQAVRNEAKSRDLTVFDATCPLVTKVHMEVARASRRGEESILIGHAGHPEVEGTMGQYSNPEGGMYLVESPDDVWKLTVKNEEKLSFMTQTTLSVDDTSDVIDALRKRFRKLSVRAKMTSATPRLTVRKRYAPWQNRRKLCWWSVRKTPPTPTVWRSWPSVWANARF
ncbi:LytB protein [Escherichia coli]|nr:LytB protein [Escherichia coli]